MAAFLERTFLLRSFLWVFMIIAIGLTIYLNIRDNPTLATLLVCLPLILEWLAIEAVLFSNLSFDMPFFIMRGVWRFKHAAKNTKVIGRVGPHLDEYFKVLRAHPHTLFTIRLPFWIAFLTTLGLFSWVVWQGAVMSGVHTSWVQALGNFFSLLPDNRYWLVGYLPLFIGVPFRFEYASIWRTPLYVLTYSKKSKKSWLIMCPTAWTEHTREISLGRTVSLQVNRPRLCDRWLINKGNIEVETSDGTEATIENIFKPWRFHDLLKETADLVHEEG